MEEHFAHTKNEEVARYLGVSRRTAVRLARGMGLEKSAEFARAETRKRMVMAERRRVAFGLEQKTALRVVKAPKAKIYLRHELRKRGYVVPHASSDATIATDTRRSAILEQRAEKMGIRFYPTEKQNGTQGR